ncbi:MULTISPECIES: prolyl oligopeptidase family serine peptidase [unclassified Pseudoxanthomonas]|uniref:prolyl oligopeptidase family serine peptidase n=1 Tax=unclassified Pseudoxanthomonas TaxID=2645906 RepID=UPI00307D7A38
MKTFPKLLGALACSAFLWTATPTRADDALALRAAIAAERARAPASQYPRTAFEASRALQSVRLSPDGRHVAYLRQLGQQRSLWLLPTAGGAARQLLPRTEADELYWSRDGRWLFAKARRTLVTLEIGGRGGMRIALDNPRGMLRVDPSQPAAVVLRERVRMPTGERWRVVRRDARGKRTLLWEDQRFIHDVALDARGRLVALMRFDGDHDALYRVDGNGRLREALRWTTIRDQAQLLAATPQGDLFLDSDAGGNFRRVLRLDRDGVLHTVHADPRGEADLDRVVLDPATQQPAIVGYRSIVAATYGLGAAQPQVAAITRKFPGRDIGITIGNGPGAGWLVSERASTLRDARWYLYDPRSGGLRRILEQEAKVSPPPPETALARKLPFAYRASDGRRVHGFLLLPPGADPARVPLVAFVHGGPINHFRADYDGIAQLLANRGYAVFESNFRGSTGHGRDYALSPRGDYGNGRVQQDIVEGVRWLLAQGIGDKDRVGIAGHSFGGYSTLLGVTFQPDLFKVGVAGAPPADMGWSMRWLYEYGNQGARADRSLATTMRLLGLDLDKPASYAHLRVQSPLANAGKLRRPVLLIAGGEDRTVPIREVIHYAAVLRRLGKDVSLYVEADGGHSPTEPLPREAYVYLMEAMLHRHLGGAKPEPPSPALHAYLKSALRIADKDDGLLAER